jgi:hypothetical protein
LAFLPLRVPIEHKYDARAMHHLRVVGVLLLILPLFASGQTSRSAVAGEAADGEWTMAAKDYANRRYSELDQITTQNVKDLGRVDLRDRREPRA